MTMADGHQTPALDEAFSPRWWPVQKPARGVVRTTDDAIHAPGWDSNLNPNHMLVQSLAGLAALAVNEGRSDEMVWIEPGMVDYTRWYEGAVNRLDLEERGVFDPWALAERLNQQGLIKGYILYRFDTSEGHLYSTRVALDHSVNVATTAAGVLQGILIDESQVEQAEAMGLALLLDARDKDMQWCVDTYKPELYRKALVTQDPRVPHCRAFAIANKVMTVYGTNQLVEDIMAWMEPLSPIIGWNSGEEFSFTVLPTLYGHFNTATNWCYNLPLLSAGSEQYAVKPFNSLDPTTIDFDDGKHAVAMGMSDGDNVQWLMGNFCSAPDYWGNADHGTLPVGWTACIPNLIQVSPETVDYLATTQPATTSIMQDAGGYYYPDRFGENRSEPDLLRLHARQVGAYMQQANVKILWFICHNLQSAAAFAAYDIYAQEIEGLLGMCAIQYTPYEGGAGNIYWATDKDGNGVPVVTARYSLWANSTTGKRSGTPAEIAEQINARAARKSNQGEVLHEWAVVHAWSYFKETPESDEPARGLDPTHWCMEQLDPSIKAVSPEELLWRIRMAEHPEHTRTLIDQMTDI